MMDFQTIILHGYGYIWVSIFALAILDSVIPKLVFKEPWKYWSFRSEKSIFLLHTNDVYYKLIEARP